VVKGAQAKLKVRGQADYDKGLRTLEAQLGNFKPIVPESYRVYDLSTQKWSSAMTLSDAARVIRAAKPSVREARVKKQTASNQTTDPIEFTCKGKRILYTTERENE